MQNIGKPSYRFMPHREQINLIKIEKAKSKNFQDQHQWKLKQHNGALKKGLKAHLFKEKLMLHRSYLTNSMQRSENRQQKYVANPIGFQKVNKNLNRENSKIFIEENGSRGHATKNIQHVTKSRLARGI